MAWQDTPPRWPAASRRRRWALGSAPAHHAATLPDLPLVQQVPHGARSRDRGRGDGGGRQRDQVPGKSHTHTHRHKHAWGRTHARTYIRSRLQCNILGCVHPGRGRPHARHQAPRALCGMASSKACGGVRAAAPAPLLRLLRAAPSAHRAGHRWYLPCRWETTLASAAWSTPARPAASARHTRSSTAPTAASSPVRDAGGRPLCGAAACLPASCRQTRHQAGQPLCGACLPVCPSSCTCCRIWPSRQHTSRGARPWVPFCRPFAVPPGPAWRVSAEAALLTHGQRRFTRWRQPNNAAPCLRRPSADRLPSCLPTDRQSVPQTTAPTPTAPPLRAATLRITW